MSIFRLVVFGFSVVALGGCSIFPTGESKNDPILFSVGDEEVRISEFQYVYEKNPQSERFGSTEDIAEYLDLYLNFKLKVQEGKRLGIHETEEFKQEFEQYRSQIAKPYMTESTLVDEEVRALYERLKQEVKASHILIRLDENASASDTLSAYERMQDIREKVLSGADFGELAEEYSEDPSARANSGNLGYFTALQMITPFEKAAFATPVGEISDIIRTQYGYHIISVEDKRPASGERKVSHLMVQYEGEAKQTEAKQKVDQIYAELEQGADWDQMVRQHSDDASTKDRGGELPWISISNVSNTFSDAIFGLEETGDISEPVLSNFGWHLFRLIEVRELASFDEMKSQLESRVSRNAQLNEELLLSKLKAENQFVKNEAAYEWVKNHLKEDAMLSIKKDDDIIPYPLFTIGGNETTGIEELIERRSKNKNKSLDESIKAFEKEKLIDFEERMLADRYPEFDLLAKEYYEGIILFQVMEEQVWGKAAQDTTGLRRFFDANRASYKHPKKIKGKIFSAKNEQIADQLMNYIDKGAYPTTQSNLFSLDEDRLRYRLMVYVDQIDQGQRIDLEVRYSASDEEKKIKEQLGFIAAFSSVRELIFVADESMDEGNFSVFKMGSQADKLVELLNKTDKLALSLHEGEFEWGDNRLPDQMAWKEGVQRFDHNGRVAVVVVEELIPEGQQSLGNIRGRVISDYQDELEREWVKYLRKKYAPSINEKELQNFKATYQP
ncbi:MAG: peptidylprolyl isomerase [Cyclobacteriaceae bacterium]|nr:peptidylprolyl isomerase [Cyclobacteriaceae bacterium]MCH8516934.1 peptidylprolyl isomerase [Cyclobacteriaceae bacterium]